MNRVIERLREKARANPRRIIFPESSDPRVIQAVSTIQSEKLAIPIVIASEPPNDLNVDCDVVDPKDPALVEPCARQLFENRKHKGLSLDAAHQALDDPLLMATLLVKTGFADAGVAGSIATTSSVIRAGLYGIGPAVGRKVISSFFLMLLDGKTLTYADCGVVPDPDSEQLAEIALASAENHQRLTGETPKVALLSFSTKGSADHPRVSKVTRSLEILRRQQPDLIVDGELQFDAAFVPEIAKRKAPNSDVAGQANVFIFPDLDSGNIAYKITERIGKAIALGPLIQGLQKPWMDLSRGCSPNDIVDVAVVASNLCDPAN